MLQENVQGLGLWVQCCMDLGCCSELAKCVRSYAVSCLELFCCAEVMTASKKEVFVVAGV